MDYAIVLTGGKQYKVTEGEKVFVELLGVEADEAVVFDKGLAVSNGDEVTFGAPYVEGATVTAKVVKNGKDKKAKAKKDRKSLIKKAAEIISELKKVSKPTFGQVVKNTSVVIVVVLICTLLLFGIDKLFSLIYDLLLPNS